MTSFAICVHRLKHVVQISRKLSVKWFVLRLFSKIIIINIPTERCVHLFNFNFIGPVIFFTNYCDRISLQMILFPLFIHNIIILSARCVQPIGVKFRLTTFDRLFFLTMVKNIFCVS